MLCLISPVKLFTNNTSELLRGLKNGLKSCNWVIFRSEAKLLVNSSVVKSSQALFLGLLGNSLTSRIRVRKIWSMQLEMKPWTPAKQLSNSSLICTPVIPLLRTTMSSSPNSDRMKRSKKISIKQLRNSPSLEVPRLATLISSATPMLFLTSRHHAEESLILNSSTSSISTNSAHSQNLKISTLASSLKPSADPSEYFCCCIFYVNDLIIF